MPPKMDRSPMDTAWNRGNYRTSEVTNGTTLFFLSAIYSQFIEIKHRFISRRALLRRKTLARSKNNLASRRLHRCNCNENMEFGRQMDKCDTLFRTFRKRIAFSLTIRLGLRYACFFFYLPCVIL